MEILMRWLKAIIILPGTVLIYVPVVLLWASNGTEWALSFPPISVFTWLSGVLVGLLGLTMICITMRLFSVKGGGGTPAPWDPINNFIVEGPYRHVRNPMIIGVNLTLLSMAILLASWPILFWLVFFFAVNKAYFILKEEPELEERYGSQYTDYKTKVPRWIPKITSYSLRKK